MGTQLAYHYSPFVVKRNKLIALLLAVIAVSLIIYYNKVTLNHDMRASMKITFLVVLLLDIGTALLLFRDACQIHQYIIHNRHALIMDQDGFSLRMRSKWHHFFWASVQDIKYIEGLEGAALVISSRDETSTVLSFSRLKAHRYEVVTAIERLSRHTVRNLPVPTHIPERIRSV